MSDTATEVEEQEEKAAPVKPKSARFPLPKGVVTPIQLRNHLVAEEIAPDTLKPQQMYAYVKSPGKGEGRFPVKWYDEDGNVYETQPTAEEYDGITRPGLPDLEEAVQWYVDRSTRSAVKKTKKSEEAEPEGEAVVEDESDDEDEAQEAEFEEAE
jgi:hypothetical protein